MDRSRRVLSLLLALVLTLSSIPMIANEANAVAYTGCLSQHDSRWGSLSYGGGTISATGCGILSLVNTVGYLSGERMDIPSVASWAHQIGSFNPNGPEGVYRFVLYPRVEAKYGSTYGIKLDCGDDGEGYWEGSNSTRLKNHLLNGGVAIGHVPNHFIAIVGYDAITNKYHLYESSPTSLRGTNYNGGDVWVTQAALASGRLCLDWFCLVSSTRSQETWIEKASFDVMVYRDRNVDLAGMTDAELKAHWKAHGIKEGRPSSTILDLGFYRNNNPDLKEAFGDDWEAIYNHFITKGYQEHRKSSALFDGNYYCERYPDVVQNYKEKYLLHYIDHGMAEGRRASLTYDPDYYWSIRPDVAETWPDDYCMAAKHYAGHGINAQIEAYDKEFPVISDVVISDVSADGYTVTCTVKDNWGIDRVVFPAWTLLNDQDDLAENFMNTQKGSRNGDTYTFRVKSSDHNGEIGYYVTHIYAVDRGGNQAKLQLDPIEVKDVADRIETVAGSRFEISEGCLKQVALGTPVSVLLAGLESGDLSVVAPDGTAMSGASVVCTGTRIHLYEKGKLVDSVTVAVMGDLDGNGAIDSTDYLRVKAAFLDTYVLSNAENASADVDGDGTVGTTDYMRIKEHFLGTYVIG
jgi:hypothetical protein